MYRGTTPTLTFKLPILTGQITALSVAIKQDGVLRLDKGLEDVTMALGNATTPERVVAAFGQDAARVQAREREHAV